MPEAVNWHDEPFTVNLFTLSLEGFTVNPFTVNPFTLSFEGFTVNPFTLSLEGFTANPFTMNPFTLSFEGFTVNPPVQCRAGSWPVRKWQNGMRKAPRGSRNTIWDALAAASAPQPCLRFRESGGPGSPGPKTGPGRFMLPQHSGQRVRVLRIFFHGLRVSAQVKLLRHAGITS